MNKKIAHQKELDEAHLSARRNEDGSNPTPVQRHRGRCVRTRTRARSPLPASRARAASTVLAKPRKASRPSHLGSDRAVELRDRSRDQEGSRALALVRSLHRRSPTREKRGEKMSDLPEDCGYLLRARAR